MIMSVFNMLKFSDLINMSSVDLERVWSGESRGDL